jgi:hypothetical protein
MKRVRTLPLLLALLFASASASAQIQPTDTPPSPPPFAPTEPPPVPGPAESPPPAPVTPVPAAPVPAPLPPVGLAQPSAGPVHGAPSSMLKRYTSWDANIDGGIGRVVSSPPETVGLLRVRAGVLVIRDPSFFAIGATYELSHLSAATLGIQGEYLHLESGFWAQVGPLVDVADKAKLGFMAAIGVSLIGIEYQGRDYNAYGYASVLFAKVRIPLGIIGFGLRGR